MCGIFGFSQLNKVTKALAPWLAWEMEERGADSWGCTDGENYEKHLGPITMSWYDSEALTKWKRGIFHTRGASVGAVTQPNAHPFFGKTKEDKLVIGIHNGHVGNWKRMNEKYKRTFEVDSAHIFAHLAERRDLNELDATGAVAWYDDGTLFLMRSGIGALEVVELGNGTLLFASTAPAIAKACQMEGVKIKTKFRIDPLKVYFVNNNDGKLYRGEKTLGFGPEIRPIAKNDNQGSIWPFAGRYQGGYKRQPECAACYRRMDSETDIVCKECLQRAVRDVRVATTETALARVN